jgi:hypothetical protein
MKKIYNLRIDLSDMPTEVTTRSFTVSGDIGSEFILYVVQDGTIKYYDWVDKSFELGHNDKNNNLKITLGGSNHNGVIKFPSGGGAYIIKLVALPGTEVQGSNKHVISKSITKQAANLVVTFKAATANTANYATFPTSTSTGGSNSVDNLNFNWDIVNASTDAGGFGLRLTGPTEVISGRFWYFTTTDTVDGAITSSTTVVVDDLTDIVAGMVISGVSSGSLAGTPTILSIDTATKKLTLNEAQTFADGITLTFKAIGSTAIKTAIGLDVIFTNYPTVTPTTLTQVVRTDSDGDLTPSTTITLLDTHGVAGGDLISYSGVRVNNSASNLITSVTPDPGGGDGDGSMVVELTQVLEAGTVLTFNSVHKTINFVGNIVVRSYPDANRTIYLDLDQLITVGAAS